MTTVRLISRKDTTLTVEGLDAIHGTPVIDVKPWYPPYDRPKEEPTVPAYVFRLAY